MKKKYKLSLVVILCAILLNVFIFLQYASYLKRESTTLGSTYVNEFLAVNYSSGKNISFSSKKQIEFSVTNQGDEKMYYYIRFNNVNGEKELISYQITSNQKEFLPINDTMERSVIVSRYEINAHETHRYTIELENQSGKEVSFTIDADLDVMDNSFSSTILDQNKITESKEETGLIEESEQYGNVYYFHGNVTNNYVSFAGLLWRIVKINEDKSVKLILNKTTEELIKMKEESNEEDTKFPNSLVSNHLESFYNTYLMNQDDKILSTNYCFDDSIMTDENNRIEYLSNVRIFDEKFPTNACGGTTFSKKIALLTADEVNYAGGTTEENKEYYLYLDSLQASWWTLTPNKKENQAYSYIVVLNNGALGRDVKETTGLFVRPVITLVKKTEVTGTGTMEDPYVVK